MILTCPACATRYFVDETKLGPQGRKVRCASCGASWQAESDEALVVEDLAPPPPPDAEPDPEPVAETAPEPEAPRPAPPLPQSFRAQVQARLRARRAVAAGAGWAGVAAALAVLVLGAVVFRVQVVRVLPRTAGAYAAVRLPVNPLGLAPEQVQAEPGLQDGHTMLFVSGVERNIEAAPRSPADVRVSLYDRGGLRLATLVAPVRGEPLSPGESRDFRTAFVDPPLSGVQVGVDFVFPTRGQRPHPNAAAASAVAQPRLRGPASSPAIMALQPVSAAQPLPASSRYALPVAARRQGSAAPS